MDKIEKLTDSISDLSKEVTRLCERAKTTEQLLSEVRSELKEIRQLSDEVATLKSERSAFKWMIGLLVPGSLVAGGTSGWLTTFINGGGGGQ
jgi:chromosome segregation ATPase